MTAAGAVAALGAGAAVLRSVIVPGVPPPDPIDALLADARAARRHGNFTAWLQASAFSERACALAPRRADAWGLLALCAHDLARGHSEPAQRRLWAERSALAVRQALAIDPSQPDGLAALTLAEVARLDRLERLAHEQRLLDILRRQPGHPDLVMAWALLLDGLGRWRESAPVWRQLRDAHELWVPTVGRDIAATWSAGDPVAAEARSAAAFALWPTHGSMWELRVRLLAWSAGPEAAEAFIRAHPAPDGTPLPQPLALTFLQALASGRRVDAERAEAAALVARREGTVSSRSAVQFLVALGRTSAAVPMLDAYLGAAAVAADPTVVVHRTDLLFLPPLRPLRGTERFDALAEAAGLAVYWRAGGRMPDPVPG